MHSLNRQRVLSSRTMAHTPNITWHHNKVTAKQRTALLKNRPCVVWLTGLSGCGKSTIAVELEAQLMERGHAAFILDGDNLRHGLCKDLGFTPEDRTENIRRAGEVAKLISQTGVIVIAGFISPYRADRATVRALLPPGEFVEVFVDAPLSICEQRDPKGLYKKARASLADGKGLGMTGLDAPYEPPAIPELHLRTDTTSVADCVASILNYLVQNQRIL